VKSGLDRFEEPAGEDDHMMSRRRMSERKQVPRVDPEIVDPGLLELVAKDGQSVGEPMPLEMQHLGRLAPTARFSEGFLPEGIYNPVAVELMNKARAARDDDDPRGAIALFLEALQIEPFLHRALLGLGNALVVEGRLGEAEVTFWRLLALQDLPKAVRRMAEASLGFLYQIMAEKAADEKDEAKETFFLTLSDNLHQEASLSSDGVHADIYADWAVTALRRGDKEKARTLLETALQADPDIVAHTLTRCPELRSLA